MKLSKYLGKDILVTWLDVWDDNEWKTIDELELKAMAAISRGVFIKEDRQMIAVARTYDTLNKNYEGNLFILKRNILKVETVVGKTKIIYEKKTKRIIR